MWLEYLAFCTVLKAQEHRQLEIQNPFNLEPRRNKWNGLIDILPQLK